MTTKKKLPKIIAMFSLKRYLASQLAKKIKEVARSTRQTSS